MIEVKPAVATSIQGGPCAGNEKPRAEGWKAGALFPGGPYVIEEDLGKGRFRLKDLNGKLLKTAINIHRLKVWNDPDWGRLKNGVSIQN